MSGAMYSNRTSTLVLTNSLAFERQGQDLKLFEEGLSTTPSDVWLRA